MKLRGRQVFNDHLAIDQTLRRFAITHNAHLQAASRVRVRQVKKMITAELRVQCDAHQTAFARLLDIRHNKQRLRIQCALFKHAHASRTLGKDHAAVGCPNNGPRHLEPAHYLLDFETNTRLFGSYNFTGATSGRRLTASNTQNYQERNYTIDLHIRCRGGPPWPPLLPSVRKGVATEGHPYNDPFSAECT